RADPHPLGTARARPGEQDRQLHGLRDLGSPDFQPTPAARLAEIFAQQRHDNVDLSGVAVIDPQLTLLPQIEANGMMHMAGFFPPVPTQGNFQLGYAPGGGRRRLVAVSGPLGTGPAGGAPTPFSSPPATPSPAPPHPRRPRPRPAPAPP